MRETGFTRRQAVAGSALLLAAPTLVRAAELDPTVWRFLVIGDWGREGRKDQRRTAAAMKQIAYEKKTEFVVGTGDNFYHWGVWSKGSHRWNTCFEGVYDKCLGDWYPVLGNHDYGGSVQAQLDYRHISPRWQMKKQWWDDLHEAPGRRPLHLFYFDTVQWLGKESFPFMIYGDDFSEQLRLEQIAAMDEALDKSPKDAIRLAVGHHGIWSVGKHGGAKRLDSLDRKLKAHEVTAWVHGHDHCLFHVEQGGMHYVCSGAGSEVLPKHTLVGACGPDQACDPAKPPVERSFYGRDPGSGEAIEGGFALFEIGRDTGSFRFYNSDAKALGEEPVRLY